MFCKILCLRKAIVIATKRLILLPVVILRRTCRKNQPMPTQEAISVAQPRTQTAFLDYFNVLLANSLLWHKNNFRVILCIPREMVIIIRCTTHFPVDTFTPGRGSGQVTPTLDLETVLGLPSLEESQEMPMESDLHLDEPKVAEFLNEGAHL